MTKVFDMLKNSYVISEGSDFAWHIHEGKLLRLHLNPSDDLHLKTTEDKETSMGYFVGVEEDLWDIYRPFQFGTFVTTGSNVVGQYKVGMVVDYKIDKYGYFNVVVDDWYNPIRKERDNFLGEAVCSSLYTTKLATEQVRKDEVKRRLFKAHGRPVDMYIPGDAVIVDGRPAMVAEVIKEDGIDKVRVAYNTNSPEGGVRANIDVEPWILLPEAGITSDIVRFLHMGGSL